MLNNKAEYHGTFQLHDLEVWGSLTLSGSDSLLRLRTEEPSTILNTPKIIHGRLHDFTLVSCIDCVGGDLPTQTWNGEGRHSLSWNVFPHQVLSGHSYFNPNKDRIRTVWFSTGDIYRIFDDFDSFGSLRAPITQLHSLLPRTIGKRQVPFGDQPRLVYFAGRCTLLDASLPFGTVVVQCWPITQSNSHGASITSQMGMQVEFEPALNLEESLKKIACIGQFLSLVAGRSQGIESIQIAVDGRESKEPPLSLFWNNGPQQAFGQELDTPSWRDIPLDGIRHKEEFKKVFERWFFSNEHAIARARLHSCREAGNQFNVDRLVAAANLFDLTSGLQPAELPQELAKVRDDCLRQLRALPRCDDRDSAIMAMSRVGAPTLMKKALSRAAVLRGHFHLENLDQVLRQAIKCRNFFVHGPGDKGFNHLIAERHVHFLTETLEFVFAATELIECGWNAGAWRRRPHTGHHWFSRYTSDYEEASLELLSDLERAKSAGQMN